MPCIVVRLAFIPHEKSRRRYYQVVFHLSHVYCTCALATLGYKHENLRDCLESLELGKIKKRELRRSSQPR